MLVTYPFIEHKSEATSGDEESHHWKAAAMRGDTPCLALVQHFNSGGTDWMLFADDKFLRTALQGKLSFQVLALYALPRDEFLGDLSDKLTFERVLNWKDELVFETEGWIMQRNASLQVTTLSSKTIQEDSTTQADSVDK